MKLVKDCLPELREFVRLFNANVVRPRCINQRLNTKFAMGCFPLKMGAVRGKLHSLVDGVQVFEYFVVLNCKLAFLDRPAPVATGLFLRPTTSRFAVGRRFRGTLQSICSQSAWAKRYKLNYNSKLPGGFPAVASSSIGLDCLSVASRGSPILNQRSAIARSDCSWIRRKKLNRRCACESQGCQLAQVYLLQKLVGASHAARLNMGGETRAPHAARLNMGPGGDTRALSAPCPSGFWQSKYAPRYGFCQNVESASEAPLHYTG